MREALWIFRKDARQLRWMLAAFWALTAARAALDIVLPHHVELLMTQVILGALYLVAEVALVAAVARAERLTNAGAYWRTRPLAWWSVLLAKLAFVAVFVGLPLGLDRLAATGTWGIAFLPLAVGAAAIALAAVTRNAVQFTLVAMGWLVGGLFGILAATQAFGYETSYWGAASTVENSVAGGFAAMVLAAALGIAYRKRAIGWARTVLVVGTLVCLAPWPGWRLAFACAERMAGPGATDTVRVEFDKARGAQKEPGNWSYYPGEDVVAVKLPVVITGIPEGALVVGERVRTTIDVPGGAHWDSGWRFIGGITGTENPGASAHTIAANGSVYWLQVNAGREFFERTAKRDVPVRLRTSAAFSMLSAATVGRLAIPCRSCAIGPHDSYSAVEQHGAISISGISTGKIGFGDADSSMTLRKDARTLDVVPTWSVDPFFTWGGIFAQGVPTDFVPVELNVALRRPAGMFERAMEWDGVRLQAYEVGRSEPRRSWTEGVRNY